MSSTHHVNTLILGAGAAGLMCAAHAGGDVLVVDHAKSPGEKIRISGGGRCNFTNLHCDPDAFLSANPHFAKSALSRYTQWDFIDLMDRHGIPWHEKALGQLFCDRSAKDVIAMLLAELNGAELWLRTEVREIAGGPDGYRVSLEREGRKISVAARALVVATGGKSIPKMGATGLAYRIADQFGLAVTETRPALVPLTLDPQQKAELAPLSGVACAARASCNGASFDEAMLITHRGLSGPAILQISSYWREGDAIDLALVPDMEVGALLKARRRQDGAKSVSTILSEVLPKALVQHRLGAAGIDGRLGDLSDRDIARIDDAIAGWRLTPTASEGYRTAEVTLGGVATDGLSSKTMEATECRGLFFIGEAVDVTGWLGGYNFQWAWSSGWAAGTEIASRGA